MLTYALKKIENGARIYEFFPQGEKRPGVIAFYDNGEREVIKESPDDSIGWHKGHALWGIDTSLNNGTIAWY